MKNLESEALTQETLKELLHYNPETGVFIWKERPIEMFVHCKNSELQCNSWNSKFAGRVAGGEWTPKNGKTSYINIKMTLKGKNRLFKAHRLVFLYTEGSFPKQQVDHIDGVGLNNRKDNLRKVSNEENSKNKPIQINNTSGAVGVTWHKKKQKWETRINVNGKQIYGGRFINIEDAIAKRKELEVKHDYHPNHGRA